MRPLIKVELTDGTVCRMAPKALDIFLTLDRVSQFKRSGSWAVVGLDPIRGAKRSPGSYGSEHRAAM